VPINTVQEGEPEEVVLDHVGHLGVLVEAFLEGSVPGLDSLLMDLGLLADPLEPWGSEELLKVGSVGIVHVVVPGIEERLHERVDGVHLKSNINYYIN
jgi:hypothetical protein